MDGELRQRARAGRTAIIGGALRGSALHELIAGVPFTDRDPFVDELLGIEPPPADEALPQGAVPYLPCPVDEVLAFAREVGPDDRFVDLGSGLGRVAILVHLLTGARSRGIELQSSLVELARARSAALGLDVAFDHGNVVERELTGTRFFLFAPCNGVMLARLVERLAHVEGPITIGTVGLELEYPWLSARRSASATLSLYDRS